MDRYYWLLFAALAGLCWGTYVPFVQAGIGGLGRNAFASFLCVGVAYFLIAVVVPIAMLYGQDINWNRYGITFATLAGVAGALGALCVIYANRNVPADMPNGRLFIAPIIFGLAPLLNTLISTVWHPSRDNPLHFGVEHLPGWKLVAGILFIGAGAALVLYSKEEAERRPAPPAPQVTPETPPQS